jgi:hypothetical protein
MNRIARFAAVLAAGGAAAALSLAPASASVHDYTVPAGSQYVQVTIPVSHGSLVKFQVWYPDNYIHVDPIPAADNVREIDNYLGQAPDLNGWDGCASTGVHQHQPDMLSKTDDDSYGVGEGPGIGPLTSLHHNTSITIKPVGSGLYFLWCHYRHGPENNVILTFKDGTQDEIWWTQNTYFREIFITYGGTVTTVTAVSADD